MYTCREIANKTR